MSQWLIMAVGAVYAFISIEQSIKGNVSLGIVFAGYAFSNVGLYMATR